MTAPRCEFCGQFGAQRTDYDQGPDGHGGRKILSLWECASCTAKNPRDARGVLQDTQFVSFGDVARRRLGMQCQYAVRYLDPARYPDLAATIRWRGALADYHGVTIHRDDVEAFVKVIRELTGLPDRTPK